jgi:hypothetical protein
MDVRGIFVCRETMAIDLPIFEMAKIIFCSSDLRPRRSSSFEDIFIWIIISKRLRCVFSCYKKSDEKFVTFLKSGKRKPAGQGQVHETSRVSWNLRICWIAMSVHITACDPNSWGKNPAWSQCHFRQLTIKIRWMFLHQF